MNRRSVSPALLAAALTAVLTAVPAAAAPLHHPHRDPAVVVGSAATLHPEGATWDAARHRFLVGSVRHGTVDAVRPDGTTTRLVDDPALVSVIGLHADAARGRVLAATGDLGVSVRSTPATTRTLAGVGAYDLATGRRLFFADLAAVAADGGPHLANDLAFGPDGTAYVTDTFAPVVYRITPDGTASVLVRDARLAAPDGAVGLNGIVREGGTLVIGKSDDGTLWRVPIDHPAALARIPVDAPAGALRHLDGMLRRSSGTIRAVTNSLGPDTRDADVVLRSEDGWRTARLASLTPSVDRAVTAVTEGPGGSVYRLSGRLDLLFAGTYVDGFTLRRVA
ncbi:gluconolaconase [Kitasatospora sp. NBC_01539]|uniref:gluconolaconase n=1 Tax=Kitasatospora sp. NBC_01539 TaxID=2903577 RepID=UPI00386020B3